MKRHVVFAWTLPGKEGRGRFRMGSFPADPLLPESLPPDCQLLRQMRRDRLRKDGIRNPVILRCENIVQSPARQKAPLRPGKEQEGVDGWIAGGSSAVQEVFSRLRTSPGAAAGAKASKKPGKGGRKAGHGAADALDWKDAVRIIDGLYSEERYRDTMLFACGCYLGLRISDLLSLRWHQLCSDEDMTVEEKKTGKRRRLRVNPALRRLARDCRENMAADDPDGYVFRSWAADDGRPITRQRAGQIIKETGRRYGIDPSLTLSTHTLRKTFGRRVWQRECEKGRGEQALILLGDVFGHSNIKITKRYLGIRQEEILSVYETLD